MTYRDNSKLYDDIGGHAEALQPIVLVLVMEILTRLTPLGWCVRHSKRGSESYSIRYEGNGQPVGGTEYHFRRDQGNTAILVYDRYQYLATNAQPVAVLKNSTDALRWVKKVAS